MSFDTDVVVVGAGVVGLACARALARAGYDVIILEQHPAFGSETSSRNSEVIHAGIYYPSGSLKARLCVQGKNLLYQFCEDYGVSYRKCGKLIVSTSADQEYLLHTIREQAIDNNVDDLNILSSEEIKALEPELHCTAALFSPSTGIIDSHGFMLALLGDAERHGAQLVSRTPVERIIYTPPGFDVLTTGSNPYPIKTRYLINAAGLGATKVAASIEGLSPKHIPRLLFAKGNYFSISGKAPFSRLVYPIPEPGGLGVHFTIDLGGQGRFGPDVEWISKIDYAVDKKRAENFYFQIRRYWPQITNGILEPAYAGVRPKLASPGEKDSDFQLQDFAEHQLHGLINLFGIESPGLTAALALADQCRSKIAQADQ
jgi:L-2-hydroxyglutarate oxidase LhgO